MILSPRFDDALAYAARAHATQMRKGTQTPYVSHLLAVASLVLEAGGNEDEAIAALLHDAPEDQGGQARLDDIRDRFGSRVAEIVEGCSDAMTENPEGKPPWRERKERYHQHLRDCQDVGVHLVSAADKLHNARATLADLRRIGPDVWSRFNASKADALWNYHESIKAYTANAQDRRIAPILGELRNTVAELG